MALRIRQLTDAEKQYFRDLANCESAPVRVLQRAYIVWLSSQGKRVPSIAREAGVSEHTVRVWLTRFSELGVKGLDDLPRPGAERKYNDAQVAEICRVAQAGPAAFGLPFDYWTLDRLVRFLHEARNIAIKRSRLNEILREEAIQWQGARGRRAGDGIAAYPPRHEDGYRRLHVEPHGRTTLAHTSRRAASPSRAAPASFRCRDSGPARRGWNEEPSPAGS